MNEPSPNRCRFDEVFSNKTKNAVSCNAVIDTQEFNSLRFRVCECFLCMNKDNWKLRVC